PLLLRSSAAARAEIPVQVVDQLVRRSLVEIRAMRNHGLDEAAPPLLVVVTLVGPEAAEIVAADALGLEDFAAPAGRQGVVRRLARQGGVRRGQRLGLRGERRAARQ